MAKNLHRLRERVTQPSLGAPQLVRHIRGNFECHLGNAANRIDNPHGVRIQQNDSSNRTWISGSLQLHIKGTVRVPNQYQSWRHLQLAQRQMQSRHFALETVGSFRQIAAGEARPVVTHDSGTSRSVNCRLQQRPLLSIQDATGLQHDRGPATRQYTHVEPISPNINH